MKVDPFKKMKHVDIICHNCKNTDILFDEHHGVIFCTTCGLVLKDLSDISEHLWLNFQKTQINL